MTLSQKLDVIEKHLVSVIKEETSRNKDDLRKELSNDILNFKDEIFGEIKTLKLESTVLASYRPILSDHEKRLSKIEKHLPSTN